MSNSRLVNHTKLSPNCSSRNGVKIDTITIHHMAGNLSVESCGSWFAKSTTKASSNYGIGTDGRVGLYVDESKRSWCSSNGDNDRRAVTIEVANDTIGGNWHVSDKALNKCIDLCVDICQRNGIKKLNYTGNKSGNLTMHKWFKNTNCPGPYLESKFPYIADEVNKRLGATQTVTTPAPAQIPSLIPQKLYRVQVGAYAKYSNAQNMVTKLTKAGFSSFVKQVNGLYKVQVGAYKEKQNATNMLKSLSNKGFQGFITFN